MKKIKVSIIVPVYNVEEYIEKCLKSLVSQTLQEIEIIVVNDGSLDNSMNTVKNFLFDSRIIVINKKNGGLSSARNIGIKKAVGKYIAFVDSDDFINETMFEELYKYAEETKSDVVASKVLLFNNKTLEITKRKSKYSEYSKNLKNPFYLFEENIEVWNKIYKRDFILKNDLYFEEGMIHEDDLFTLRVFLSTNKIKFLDKYHYFYRIEREGSIITRLNKEKSLKSLEKILNFLINIKINEKEIYLILKLEILKLNYRQRIMCLKREKNISKSEILQREILLKNNWKYLSSLEKKILKINLRKVLETKGFSNINIFNIFYWRNRIFNFRIIRKIIVEKLKIKYLK